MYFPEPSKFFHPNISYFMTCFVHFKPYCPKCLYMLLLSSKLKNLILECLMLKNGRRHFKKSCRFKIYYQMQDCLLEDFENVFNHFVFLGIKSSRIFLKRFSWNLLLFFTISTFKLTSVSIHLYICTSIFELPKNH